MFTNYFKTAFRHILRGRVYSFIHISGLALGMAVALLIGLWANHQLSYDHFLPGHKQAYQVKLNFNYNGNILTQSSASLPLATALREKVPGIRYVCEDFWIGPHALAAGEHKLRINGQFEGVDFFRIFPFPFVDGNPGTALKDPYSIVLTQSTAKALFGNEDAMGKMVLFENEHNLRVVGIVKDPPDNSSFQFAYVVPFSYLVATNDWVKRCQTDKDMNAFQIFLALKPNADADRVAQQVKDMAVEKSTAKIEVILHPLDKWRLYAQFENGKAVGGFIQYVRIFSLVGLLVLVIACINFVNLATARSERRAREVGLRKAIGSARKDLIVQFLIESLGIAFVAFLFSILLAQLALPGFNALAQSHMDIPYSNPVFWLAMTGYVLLTGLLAGIRPAFYFSSFQPVKILRGVRQGGSTGSSSRKILVVVQFACSFALIAGTLVIYNQIRYGKDRPIGYDVNRLLEVDMTRDLQKNYEPLRNELLRDRLAESIATASATPDGFSASNALTAWPGQKAGESLEMPITGASKEYFRTVGMKLIAGREFTGDADSINIILNEAAVKRLRLVDPLRSLITIEYSSKPFRVVGVVGDAIMGSPFQAAIPSIFTYNPNWANNLLLRLPAGVALQDGVARLSAVFNKYNPSTPFLVHFADENYAHKFDAETMLGTLSVVFAALAIFISCLGLFGLSAYMAEQRTREIGIRKVVGASVWQIWKLLSTNFIWLVGLGCIIAIPLAYYLFNGWLQQYDYRISIGPWVFVVSTAMAILIAVLTVSFQVLKTARANPVKSLRSE